MKFIRSLGLLALSLCSLQVAKGATKGQEECNEQEASDHPVLCSMLDRLRTDPHVIAEEMYQWALVHNQIVNLNVLKSESSSSSSLRQRMRTDDNEAAEEEKSSSLPVVFGHGMGDACENEGMQNIGKHTSQLLGGAYVTCIASADNRRDDTTNGYFLDMNSHVDIFAQKVQSDPKLAKGFHGIGFSQGNNIIRGYIAKYNDPPVHTFISINGVNAGEGAVPYCKPSTTKTNQEKDGATVSFGSMCDLLMEQASRRAYTEFAQKHSFQANYWRDPRPVEKEAYQEFSQLAQWNNEGKVFNQTLVDNWSHTSKFVWVLAEQDGMVWPKEGEQWGAPDPSNPFEHILPMNQTEWYIKDLFGLRTAQEAGKNYFESFDGDHLQFSIEDFDGWVSTYLLGRGDVDGHQSSDIGTSVA